MNIKEISSEDFSVKFEVTMLTEEINEIKQQHLAKIATNVTIPGFRKGKAPLDLVEKNYANKVNQDVLDDALKAVMKKLQQENSLLPVHQHDIVVDEFTETSGLKVIINAQKMPEVPEVDFSQFTLEKHLVEVTDDDINKSLDEIANYYKDFEDLEDQTIPARNNDVVVIDFTGKIDGEEFQGGSARDFPLELGSNMFIPGFEEQLIGKKVSEELEVNVTFPEDYHAKHLAGKPVVFDVVINKLQRSKPALIDDELAKKYGFDNLDLLKEDIKQKCLNKVKVASNNDLRIQLLKKLRDMLQFPLPNKLLNEELDAGFEMFKKFQKQVQEYEDNDMLYKLNLTDEQLSYAKMSDEEVTAKHLLDAEANLRAVFLINDIAKKNQLQFTMEDVEDVFKREAYLYRQSVEEVKRYYQENQNALQGMQNKAQEEAVLKFLFTKVNYQEKVLSFDEYIKNYYNG